MHDDSTRSFGQILQTDTMELSRHWRQVTKTFKCCRNKNNFDAKYEIFEINIKYPGFKYHDIIIIIIYEA